MVLAERLCFVQFMHPGGEHRPDRSDHISWNRNPHRRKYLRVDGRFLQDDQIREGPLEFWGEWEPESKVLEHIAEPTPLGPTRVWHPYYVPKRDYSGLRDTDPFVFDGFWYTICQQNTIRGPTQLRRLAMGSVVLFGSCVDGRFAIDTVLVVRDAIDHDARTYRQVLANQVPDAYWEVTLGPWYAPHPEHRSALESYRLYRGATMDDPVHGMFSFFPCVPAERGSRGFERPAIDLPDAITPHLPQGKRLNPQQSLEDVRQLWQTVVDQVLAQSLALGVWAEMPPH